MPKEIVHVLFYKMIIMKIDKNAPSITSFSNESLR